jgi:anti-sigma B factor antagonist
MLIRTWSLDETLAVIDLTGGLCAENGTALREAVSAALAAGRRQLVLNLVDVSALDAAGIGELANALKLTRAAGGELRLVFRRPHIRELLERTRLLGLFQIFPSEVEAIASFAALMRQ